MMKHKLRSFLFWEILLNWPPLVLWMANHAVTIPVLNVVFTVVGMISFLPFLIWINIPASLIGETSYLVFREMGALPQTPFAWLMLSSFWTLIAIVLALLTSYYPGQKRQKDGESKG